VRNSRFQTMNCAYQCCSRHVLLRRKKPLQNIEKDVVKIILKWIQKAGPGCSGSAYEKFVCCCECGNEHSVFSNCSTQLDLRKWESNWENSFSFRFITETLLLRSMREQQNIFCYSVWFGSVWFGLFQFGSVRFVSVRFGSVRCN